MTDLTPLAVTIPNAVEITGLGRTSLYHSIKQGKLKVKKSGRRTIIEMAELRRFIENLPASGSENG